MRLSALFLAALLLVPTSGAARAAAPIATETLPDGLKVVVVEDHSAPVVQTGMWYRFGAQEELTGKTGLAHALEHMMFRGTPSISSSGLDELSARLGAELNANTSNDYTHYYFVLPADRYNLGIRIEADRMRDLNLSEADWKLEKGAVLSEYDSDLSQPIVKLYDAVCRAAATARICGLSALGERKDIVDSTASDLRRYYDAYYAPNNATLVVTGDVNPAEVFASAKHAFASVPARTLPAQTAPTVRYARGASVAVSADFPFEVVDMAYAAPGNRDPGYAAMQLADSVITNQRSAFYRNLVLSGLTLGYETSYDANVHDALYHVFLIVSPGHTGTQIRAAFEQTLAQTEAQGFPLDLIDAAKIAVSAQAVYARDSITGLGDRVGYALGVEGIADPAIDDEAVRAATPAQVNIAAKHFLATPAVVGTLHPRARKPGEVAGPPSSGVSDTFGNRAPSGPLRLAPWAKAELDRPVTLTSKINPTQFTLPNGMHLLVQRVPGNPTVFVTGRIESSPRFDPPGKTGTGALATSLLSYGSRSYDFTEQRKIADDLGASFEFGTSFGAHGMAKDLGALLDVVADAQEHPSFDPQYVELLRQQTLASIMQRDRDPQYLASRAFDRLLLPPNDPDLREADAASVRAIGIDDLRRYTAAYLRPDLTTISVVGDVTPEQARAAVQHAFGSWSANGPTPDVAQSPIPLPSPASKYITAAGRTEVSARLGQPAPSRLDPSFYPMNLLNTILGGGGGFDTRLMSEIRVKRGLVYDVSSSLDVDRRRGALEFRLSASPNNIAPAVSVLKAQLVRLQREAVSEDELSRAKSKLLAGTLVVEQATETIASQVQNIGRFGLPSNYYQTLNKRYGAITAQDIQRSAQTHLFPDHLVEVFEGPQR